LNIHLELPAVGSGGGYSQNFGSESQDAIVAALDSGQPRLPMLIVGALTR
jgi:hypothetical protein